MRKGIILAYNTVVHIGMIMDENHQHIRFQKKDIKGRVKPGEEVIFEIGIRKGWLAATKITSIKVDDFIKL